MLVGPRTGASGRMVLAHSAGTRRSCVPSGEVVGTSLLLFPHNGKVLEMHVLDGVNARSLAGFWVGVLCMGPMHWIRGWGLAYGIYPGGSALVMGDLMGRRFWVGCWFFSWGVGGGEEELQGTAAEAFSQDDASSKQSLYVIYFILRSGSFTASCARQSRTVAPILDALDRHVHCSSFDNLMTSSTHQRQ